MAIINNSEKLENSAASYIFVLFSSWVTVQVFKTVSGKFADTYITFTDMEGNIKRYKRPKESDQFHGPYHDARALCLS